MKLYIYVTHKELFLKGEYAFSLSISSDADLAEDEIFRTGPLLGSVDFDINGLADIDALTKEATANLDDCIQRVRAKAQNEVTEFERRKSELLAITHQPSKDK